MEEKLIYILMITNKIIPFEDKKYWLESLDRASFEPFNEYLIKVPKVFKPTNETKYL